MKITRYSLAVASFLSPMSEGRSARELSNWISYAGIGFGSLLKVAATCAVIWAVYSLISHRLSGFRDEL
jgi:hypothetical protein